jgi:hypothetical protein
LTKNREDLLEAVAKVLAGKPIDEVAPVLVVAVARVLLIDSGGDPDKTAFLIAKFLDRLAHTVQDMMTGDPEETVH